MADEPEVNDPEIERDAALAVHKFLLEIMFSIICELHPDGQREAFHRIESSLLDIMRRSVANNQFSTSARDVELSDEAERQLKLFLASLAQRIGS